jgi:purine-nucleoside phosphorylase
VNPSPSSIVAQAAAAVRRETDLVPEIALVLGSGLGGLADEVEDPVVIPFSRIPGFATSTVHGHVGALVLGRLEGRPVGVLKGRVHYYEGHSMAQIVLPVRVLCALGARTLLVTNACGGISEHLKVGDLMLIRDHLNLMGDNPLRGPNDDSLGPRFPAMSRAYDADLLALARKVAAEVGFVPAEGVYCALAGPSYETPAEIRMLSRLGADAVGMSTAPETIAAVHAGMRVLGISCVTNILHQGPSQDTHEDVLRAAAEARPRFVSLVRGVVREISG